jgi:hypothetical protein
MQVKITFAGAGYTDSTANISAPMPIHDVVNNILSSLTSGELPPPLFRIRAADSHSVCGDGFCDLNEILGDGLTFGTSCPADCQAFGRCTLPHIDSAFNFTLGSMDYSQAQGAFGVRRSADMPRVRLQLERCALPYPDCRLCTNTRVQVLGVQQSADHVMTQQGSCRCAASTACAGALAHASASMATSAWTARSATQAWAMSAPPSAPAFCRSRAMCFRPQLAHTWTSQGPTAMPAQARCSHNALLSRLRCSCHRLAPCPVLARTETLLTQGMHTERKTALSLALLAAYLHCPRQHHH